MKDLPAIGTARGVFDIFIPGAFLLLHGIAAVWLYANNDPTFSLPDTPLTSNAILSAATFICFGYLIGILLRLLKTGMPDRLSGRLLWLLVARKWPAGKPFLHEAFPYFAYLRYVTRTKLPREAALFFNQYWLPRARMKGRRRPRTLRKGNKHFFNYCKNIINSVDDRGGAEAIAAEALTRYVSSMLYALLGSAALMAFVALKLRSLLLCFTVIGYGCAILIILYNLRFLRFKEVEALFTATFQNFKILSINQQEDK